MATMKAKYLGQLRVECEHVASGTKMMTDAPVDNCGKGEAFSPTDLCAAALGSCILTTMGIYAGQHNIDLGEIIPGIVVEKPARLHLSVTVHVVINAVLHLPAGEHHSVCVK